VRGEGRAAALDLVAVEEDATGIRQRQQAPRERRLARAIGSGDEDGVGQGGLRY
jgi:hypothetical protein